MIIATIPAWVFDKNSPEDPRYLRAKWEIGSLFERGVFSEDTYAHLLHEAKSRIDAMDDLENADLWYGRAPSEACEICGKPSDGFVCKSKVCLLKSFERTQQRFDKLFGDGD